MHTLFFDHALLPGGWAHNVRVGVENDVILSVEGDASEEGAQRYSGIAVPGLPNVHCHAFQRAMAGLAERRGPFHDSFWTWREVMYRFLARLVPEDVEAIAAFAYMEMLESGFTTVVEFHYLHHDCDGRPYADIGEMVSRVAAAAQTVGIGLTLLPSLYMTGGFGEAAPTEGQKRFVNDTDAFLRLVARSREIVSKLPDARVGIAPHSLRAVPKTQLMGVLQAWADGPIHIHAAEQVKEVEDSVAALGARPVEWLLNNANINARWCVIHATHMTSDETEALARSGAVAGLCPLTEASLGDGIFDGAGYVAANGRFGVGTDSNIQIDAGAELRQLEYSQRLALRARNVMASRDGDSVGRRLFETALAGGAQASARPIGAVDVGKRADIVLLDPDHPDIAAGDGDHWLDAWIYIAGKAAVRDVLIGGAPAVANGRHRHHEAITRRYVAAVKRLLTQ